MTKKRSMMAFFKYGEEYTEPFPYWKHDTDYYQCPECSNELDESGGDNTRFCTDCDFDEKDGIWVDLYSENHEEVINEFELNRMEKEFGKLGRRTNES